MTGARELLVVWLVVAQLGGGRGPGHALGPHHRHRHHHHHHSPRHHHHVWPGHLGRPRQLAACFVAHFGTIQLLYQCQITFLQNMSDFLFLDFMRKYKMLSKSVVIYYRTSELLSFMQCDDVSESVSPGPGCSETEPGSVRDSEDHLGAGARDNPRNNLRLTQIINTTLYPIISFPST